MNPREKPGTVTEEGGLNGELKSRTQKQIEEQYLRMQHALSIAGEGKWEKLQIAYKRTGIKHK